MIDVAADLVFSLSRNMSVKSKSDALDQGCLARPLASNECVEPFIQGHPNFRNETSFNVDAYNSRVIDLGLLQTYTAPTRLACKKILPWPSEAQNCSRPPPRDRQQQYNEKNN